MQPEKPDERLKMERQKVQLGLSKHFPRNQWLADPEYHRTKLNLFEVNLKSHGPTVRTAFQNIIAFLKSIHKKDSLQCEEDLESILELDSININALIGLYEITASSSTKSKCKQRINEIMKSDEQKRAISKALLEIGLALCLLIPKYRSQDCHSTESQQTDLMILPDDNHNLDFTTAAISMDTDLYTDSYIAQKKRVYSSLRYLQEGLNRFAEVQMETEKSDVLIWNYFLAMTYNRLDNWISYTRGCRKLRKQFSLKSLALFCEMTVALDQDGDDYNRLYYHRCFAYIGTILLSRKEVLTHGEKDEYVPDCLQSSFLKRIWENPTEAFTRALEYGYDPVIYTRNAKRLFHEGEMDSAIKIVDDMIKKDPTSSVNWYAAVIRMRAYKSKHQQCFMEAVSKGNISTLTDKYLIEAESSAKYCFNTNATENDLSTYAIILRWLGTFPDGQKVTNKKRIRNALTILDRIYEEQGCHTNFIIHKTRANCHADLGEIDEAIKYMVWSMNSCPTSSSKPSIAFKFVIEYLLNKLTKHTPLPEKEKSNIQRQIKYYIDVEISRCHDLIRNAEGQLDDTLINEAKLLLDNYDKTILDNLKAFASSDHQKVFVQSLDKKYSIIFKNMSHWCRCYPEEVKHFLNFTADLATTSSLRSMITMFLKNLGRDNRDWCQTFSRRWKAKPQNEAVLELCSPSSECLPAGRRYDFLVIHAPEDKDWVFFTLLPEMEDRPTAFKGCIPDRDFVRGDTFETNVKNYLNLTSKVVLLVTSKFFERVYGVLKNSTILDTLESMHAKGTADVIVLFCEQLYLDMKEHRQLMTFENIDASGSYFEWNCLRILLVQRLPSSGTKRPPVIWEEGIGEHHVRPREFEDDKYGILEKEILPYGVPAAMYTLYKSAYIIGYDGALKVPRWVAHKLDRTIPRGIVSRKTHKKALKAYHADRDIPAQARSSEKDYAQIGNITKGHVTPLGDHSSTVKAARETMLLTNMVPEVKNNFLWNRLEEYCRDKLTEDLDTIYIISGTLFRPNAECSGKVKELTYQVIGDNELAVPTHMFKVIIGENYENPDNKPCVGAFIVPNVPLFDADLHEITVSISQLEKWLGTPLCEKLSPELKSKSDSDLPDTFFSKHDRVRKMLRYVDSLDDLDVVWDGLSDALRADQDLLSVYEDKKSHLEKKQQQKKHHEH